MSGLKRRRFVDQDNISEHLICPVRSLLLLLFFSFGNQKVSSVSSGVMNDIFLFSFMLFIRWSTVLIRCGLHNVVKVCFDVFIEPVATLCGHVFCKECLNDWLASQPSCPTCKSNQWSTAYHGCSFFQRHIAYFLSFGQSKLKSMFAQNIICKVEKESRRNTSAKITQQQKSSMIWKRNAHTNVACGLESLTMLRVTSNLVNTIQIRSRINTPSGF